MDLSQTFPWLNTCNNNFLMLEASAGTAKPTMQGSKPSQNVRAAAAVELCVAADVAAINVWQQQLQETAAAAADPAAGAPQMLRLLQHTPSAVDNSSPPVPPNQAVKRLLLQPPFVTLAPHLLQLLQPPADHHEHTAASPAADNCLQATPADHAAPAAALAAPPAAGKHPLQIMVRLLQLIAQLLQLLRPPCHGRRISCTSCCVELPARSGAVHRARIGCADCAPAKQQQYSQQSRYRCFQSRPARQCCLCQAERMLSWQGTAGTPAFAFRVCTPHMQCLMIDGECSSTCTTRLVTSPL